MKTKRIGVLISFMLLAACGESSKSDTSPTSDAASVSMDNLRVLEGAEWTGSLSYLNYNAPNRSTIPVEAVFRAANDAELQYEIRYPDEPQYNSTETLALSAAGTRIEGHEIVSREITVEGALKLVTEGDGEDNGQEAVIQTEYLIGSSKLVIRKNVRYTDADDFFNRNEFALTR